eukprot:Platyproteum_vivax@DN6861_c0_g1_i1.p2
MGDLSGLFETIKEIVPMDKQPELMNRLAQGVFTIRDMKEQFQNVLNLGPISKVMSMIPGFNQSLLTKGSEQEGVKRVKGFMTMMDSMTDQELDGEKALNAGRVHRIAKGSGHFVHQVTELMEEYKRFSKLVGKMGKIGLTKGGGPDVQQMMRNPGQMMQKLNKVMDPKMLQQMGGAGNMVNLMKEMGKMENMDDMMKHLQKKG